jgi:molecular chaperone Hsp33
MLTLAILMAKALKFDGVFTLQAKGNGPVSLLIADITSDGSVRGYASFDPDKISNGTAGHAGGSVPMWLGEGYLAFTVDQGDHTQRYQGIVELSGETLAACLQHYFRQSEQIDAGIEVAAGKGPNGEWRSGGLMIQRLPDTPNSTTPTDREDDWRRAMVLMASVTDEELLNPALSAPDLLYRLFHEDGVRVFNSSDLSARCRCSLEKVTNMLSKLPKDEISELTEDDGKVHVTCEFCTTDYAFGLDELAALYAET